MPCFRVFRVFRGSLLFGDKIKDGIAAPRASCLLLRLGELGAFAVSLGGLLIARYHSTSHPATWGFRKNSGQRESRGSRSGRTGRPRAETKTDKARQVSSNRRHIARGSSPMMVRAI
jgi:hypothetical protein